MGNCSIDGCNKGQVCKGFCKYHYKKDLQTRTTKLCSVKNCNEKYFESGHCKKHLYQLKYHGKILERIATDANHITVNGDICIMDLYNQKNIKIAETIFDLKYRDTIDKYKWHLKDNHVNSKWYDFDGQHGMYLHQAIIFLSGKEVQNGEEIDHKDCNPLNNLENNLRICNSSQNKHNVKIRKNNTSGQKCVSWRKDHKMWEAYITNNYNREHLGLFTTKEEAARAYNAAAIKYFGEFAQLNQV